MNINLSEAEIQTVISALDVWMEQPELCEGAEWLRRQDAGADLVKKLSDTLSGENTAKAERMMKGTAAQRLNPCAPTTR